MAPLAKLLSFCRTCPPEVRIWPCLVGPSGSGKTSRARQLAAQLHLPLHVVLVGTMPPEDVGGVCRAVDTGRALRLEWALPEWAHEPGLVLLDELDKAAPEHWGAILTLLASHTLRGQPLPPETVFIAAMQPVAPADWLADETGVALAARLCWIPVSQAEAYGHLSARYGRPVPPWACAETPDCPWLPEPTPRQAEWLMRLWDREAELAVRELALAGTVAPPMRDAVRDWLETDHAVRAQAVLRALSADRARVAAMAPLECAQLIPHAAVSYGTDLAVVEDLLVRMLSECTPEEVYASLRAMYDAIRAQPQDEHGTVGGWEPHPEAAVAAMWDRAAQRAFDALAPLASAAPRES